MRYAASVIAAYLLLTTTPAFAQGTSCSNAIALTLDGIGRSYSVSSTVGSAVYCTSTPFIGSNSRVTYFQFSTNSTAQCVSLEVLTSSTASLEIALCTACSGGNVSPAAGVTIHNMCMPTGNGIWAPDLSSNLLPNTTYYLRMKTESNFAGTIQIMGKYVTPVNDNCLGATPISAVPTPDNNACHTPGPGVIASQLCASTLENTAWYTYTIQNNGSTTFTVDNIECNNGNNNNTSGFQIGFFKGSCSGLVSLTCNDGVGGMVQATASNLLAGERVYVAIDGLAGSNCKYTVSATNAQSLPAYLKNFLAVKTATSNILKWTTLQEFQNNYFEIQRAADAVNFSAVGTIQGSMESNSEKSYQYEDNSPLLKAYYRLKQVDIDGRFKYSNILEVTREKIPEIKIKSVTANSGTVRFSIESDLKTEASYAILNMTGNMLKQEKIALIKGTNHFYKNITSFATGKYILLINSSDTRCTQSFYNSINASW